MPKRVQRLGHAAAVAQAFVGKQREITVDTTELTVRVHDGATPGGTRLARADAANLQVVTAGQDGKMPASLFTSVQTAFDDIAALVAGVSVNVANINALQVDIVTKALLIPTPTANKLLISAGEGNAAESTLSKNDIAQIPENTLALFVQAAAPTGWQLDTTHNDAIFRVSNVAGGGVGGDWTIVGLLASATGGHVLTIPEMPTHTHSAENQGAPSFGQPLGQIGDTAGQTGPAGGDQPHSHPGSTISHDGTWRPAYVDAIICKRLANA